MLTERPKNEIPIVLTNTSTLASSTVNLFSLGAESTSGNVNGSPASVDGLQIGIYNSDFVGSHSWRFFYNGIVTAFIIGNPTDIDDLVTSLNTEFGDVFWKETGTLGFDWYLRVAASSYTFGLTIISAIGSRTFASFATGFVAGTTITANTEINVSYAQISTDLTTQPYIITTVYVFSSTDAQNTAPFTVVTTEANGTSTSRPFKPLTSPDQSNLTQANIPIYMPTSAYNQLQYTLQPSATVTMIVRYEHVDLFDALELMSSGEFQAQMEVLKQQDTAEYNRIMKVVSGQDIAGELLNQKSWNENISKKVEKIKYFVVPLIYVVHKENGDDSVVML